MLKKKAFFVPTNGQTEQVYLAKRMMKAGIAYYSSRSKLDIENQFEKALSYQGLGIERDDRLLRESIHEFLAQINP